MGVGNVQARRLCLKVSLYILAYFDRVSKKRAANHHNRHSINMSVDQHAIVHAAADLPARRFLVTGANKGIGLAICERILASHADAFVLLGSRDVGRGEAARATLSAPSRCAVVAIDVCSEQSVQDAAAFVAALFGGAHLVQLAGLVCNAGVNTASAADTIDTNVRGTRRVVSAFMPLLSANAARIVNISSGAASMFLAKCAPERVAFFLDRTVTWPALEAAISEVRTSFSCSPCLGWAARVDSSWFAHCFAFCCIHVAPF